MIRFDNKNILKLVKLKIIQHNDNELIKRYLHIDTPYYYIYHIHHDPFDY